MSKSPIYNPLKISVAVVTGSVSIYYVRYIVRNMNVIDALLIIIK